MTLTIGQLLINFMFWLAGTRVAWYFLRASENVKERRLLAVLIGCINVIVMNNLGNIVTFIYDVLQYRIL